MATLRSQQGDTLDALLWRELGFGSADLPGVVTTNPGIADLGEVLPLGTVVTVPATQVAPATASIPLVQLWS